MELSPARKFVRPVPGEDWAELASRALPAVAADEAIGLLQSWNFHVFMRPAAANGSTILPSDVVFIEAPKPA
ncbi:MAG: hypothetical protein AB8B93_20755 [Pseudomonadales bacterium]